MLGACRRPAKTQRSYVQYPNLTNVAVSWEGWSPSAYVDSAC